MKCPPNAAQPSEEKTKVGGESVSSPVTLGLLSSPPSPPLACLKYPPDLFPCQPHLNVLPQAPFKSLRSSSLHPSDPLQLCSLSSTCSLALPRLSPHPAALIAPLVCQMSRPISPPVKRQMSGPAPQLGKLNKAETNGRPSPLTAIDSDRQHTAVPEFHKGRVPAVPAVPAAPAVVVLIPCQRRCPARAVSPTPAGLRGEQALSFPRTQILKV